MIMLQTTKSQAYQGFARLAEGAQMYIPLGYPRISLLGLSQASLITTNSIAHFAWYVKPFFGLFSGAFRHTPQHMVLSVMPMKESGPSYTPFPANSSSRAERSPCRARPSSSRFSASLRTLSLAVFTPQISTLLKRMFRPSLLFTDRSMGEKGGFHAPNFGSVQLALTDR